MAPSFLPVVHESRSSNLPLQQSWHQRGSCPEGTIPIRRVRKSDLLRAASLERFGRKYPLQSRGRILAPGVGTREGAGVVFSNNAEHWRGASAELNVWGPSVELNEFSLTSVTVSNDKSPGSVLEAGYVAHPGLFGDSKPRFFAYWTADSDKSTGCFNLLCSGFIQVSSQIALGGALNPISTYDGPQYAMETKIYKDSDDSKWWLFFNSEKVGYWPMSIINDLDVMVDATWAGWVLNTGNEGHHTTTQMGSGHFSEEGVNKSAFIRNLLVINQDNSIPPTNSFPFATKEGCYNVKSLGAVKGDVFYLFYGGPGGPNCG